MVHRYRGGLVPEAPGDRAQALDLDLEAAIGTAVDAVKANFRESLVSLALQDTWSLVRHVNKYIVEREPWTLAKDAKNTDVLNQTLYRAADALRVIAALVEPVIPDAASRIRRMLGVGAAETWTTLRAGTLTPGTRLGDVEPLFPRIEKTVEELRSMTTGNEPPATPPPSAPVSPLPASAIPAPAAAAVSAAPGAPSAAASSDGRIGIDDFMKVELRVAKVLEAEAVPKSKKLIKLKVDAGSEQRTILAGIAEAYTPEQLVGRTIVIVANLEPRKMMGLESQGMVLAASVDNGLPSLVAVDESLPAGARVR
jgi:methionyl-tRNA synthetase